MGRYLGFTASVVISLGILAAKTSMLGPIKNLRNADAPASGETSVDEKPRLPAYLQAEVDRSNAEIQRKIKDVQAYVDKQVNIGSSAVRGANPYASGSRRTLPSVPKKPVSAGKVTANPYLDP